jgi:hypothetical protein
MIASAGGNRVLAGYVLRGRGNIAGADCGFAQGPFVRRVYDSIMWA